MTEATVIVSPLSVPFTITFWPASLSNSASWPSRVYTFCPTTEDPDAAHESHVRAALERLKLLGASDREIAALKQAEQVDPNFSVPAPINGVILTRAANLRLVVNSAQELFTVADLSTVWVMASVNEKDFASMRVGSAASITAPLCSAKNLIVLNFRPLFMPLASPVGIRDADRPEQAFLPVYPKNLVAFDF